MEFRHLSAAWRLKGMIRPCRVLACKADTCPAKDTAVSGNK